MNTGGPQGSLRVLITLVGACAQRFMYGNTFRLLIKGCSFRFDTQRSHWHTSQYMVVFGGFISALLSAPKSLFATPLKARKNDGFSSFMCLSLTR